MHVPTRYALLAATAALVMLSVSPATATHADGVYDQKVWFEWNTTTLDILVIPPEPGLGASVGWLDATLDSFEQWEVGIATHGADWFKDGVTRNIYVLPFDVPPASAIQDAEIVVTPVGTPVVAAAVQSPLTRQCYLTTGFLSYDSHFTFMSHEYGHCLGLDHPGDGGNAQNTFHPPHDVMSYGPDPDLPCVSNLNIRAMERVFGSHFGQPSGGAATMPTGDYTQIDCNSLFGA